MNETKLEAVAAVLDAQGFQINKKFVIRELSVAGAISGKFTLATQINKKKLNSRQLKTLQYTKDFVHGLEFEDLEDYPLKQGDIQAILTTLYLLIKEKGLIAISNDHLSTLLEKLKIPFVDLKFQAPSFKYLYGVSYITWDCPLHPQPLNPNHRCASLKSTLLWSWIRGKKALHLALKNGD